MDEFPELLRYSDSPLPNSLRAALTHLYKRIFASRRDQCDINTNLIHVNILQ